MSTKTPFAGLTRLGIGESLAADNFSFQNANPAIIDLLLRLGAVAHRHDGHQALAAPLQDPFVQLAAVGGQIPAATSIYVAYTYVDANGGETLTNPTPGVVTSAAGLAAPDSAPLLAVDHVAGTLLAGTYSYALTVVDGTGGETPIGPFSTITIPAGSPTSRIQISGLQAVLAATGGVAWRLWKRVNGGQLGVVNQGATDTLTDDGSFGVDCTVAPPITIGTTNGTNKLNVTVPPGAPAAAVSFRIYGSVDGSFPSPCLLGTYPIAEAGQVKSYVSLTAGDGAPPDVSTAFPGASFIDADTEVVNLRVRAPVATAADLPAGAQNREGDIRVTLNDHTLHVWNGAAWQAAFTDRPPHVIRDQADAVMPARANLTFHGPWTSVVDDAPNDRTIVTVSEPQARQAVATPAWVGAALNASSDFAVALAKSYMLMKIATTLDARVRVYTTAAARAADAARAFGVAPAGSNHGVIADVQVTAAAPAVFTPALLGWNDDAPPSGNAYVSVTALAAGDVTVNFTFVPMEF